jgi:hypothetical protein
MAFNELDLRRIERIVGGFCRRRSQPEVADEPRLIYEVDGQSVVISEVRPDWRDPVERMHTPVAKHCGAMPIQRWDPPGRGLEGWRHRARQRRPRLLPLR